MRKKILSKIVELIRKLEPQESDAAAAIKKSELSADCKQSLILSEGVTDQKLNELLKLQDDDLEDTFKLLLKLFAEGYKRAYVFKNYKILDSFSQANQTVNYYRPCSKKFLYLPCSSVSEGNFFKIPNFKVNRIQKVDT